VMKNGSEKGSNNIFESYMKTIVDNVNPYPTRHFGALHTCVFHFNIFLNYNAWLECT